MNDTLTYKFQRFFKWNGEIENNTNLCKTDTLEIPRKTSNAWNLACIFVHGHHTWHIQTSSHFGYWKNTVQWYENCNLKGAARVYRVFQFSWLDQKVSVAFASATNYISTFERVVRVLQASFCWGGSWVLITEEAQDMKVAQSRSERSVFDQVNSKKYNTPIKPIKLPGSAHTKKGVNSYGEGRGFKSTSMWRGEYGVQLNLYRFQQYDTIQQGKLKIYCRRKSSSSSTKYEIKFTQMRRKETSTWQNGYLREHTHMLLMLGYWQMLYDFDAIWFDFVHFIIDLHGDFVFSYGFCFNIVVVDWRQHNHCLKDGWLIHKVSCVRYWFI